MDAPASQALHPVLESERCHASITTHERATCRAMHSKIGLVILLPAATSSCDDEHYTAMRL
jgi:hypothetical protein